MMMFTSIFPAALFLFLQPFGASADIEGLHEERFLAGECNRVVGSVTLDQVQELGKLYLNGVVEAGAVANSQNVLFRTTKYDLDVVKICGSCASIDGWYFDLKEKFPADYRSYCDEAKFGYSDTQSALVFLPRQPEGEVLENTKLRSFMYFRETLANKDAAPTMAWPQDLNSTIILLENRQGLPPAIGQFVPSLLAASSGSIAILPDYIGFGESAINPAFLNRRAYEQSAVVSFLLTRKYLYTYHTCTMLDFSAMTMQGIEDGAFGAVFAAQALRRFGLKVLTVFAGSGLYDLDTLIDNAIQTVDGGGQLFQRSQDLLALAAFSFSVSTPGLLNTGRSQDLVSETHRDFILSKFSPSATATARQSIVTGLEVLNPDILRLYRNAHAQGISSPCKTEAGKSDAFVDHLCQAIAEASAWPMLRDETESIYTFIHRTELCYSTVDPIISARQVEDGELHTLGGTLVVYDGPKGTSEEDTLLKPLGTNHQRVVDICRITSGLFYGLQGHKPVAVEDHPSYMLPLDAEDSERCGVATTVAPEVSETPAADTPEPSNTGSGTIDSSQNGGSEGTQDNGGGDKEDEDETDSEGSGTWNILPSLASVLAVATSMIVSALM